MKTLQNVNIKELLDDEVLIIENGGEIPEVTYHGSLYYLTEDPGGPGAILSEDDMLRLKLAVVEGYRRIISRDLMVENRDKSLYRGLERCAANWDRLMVFSKKENLDLQRMAEAVCEGLRRFFNVEVGDVITFGKRSSVNCTPETLRDFFSKVGLDHADLPEEWENLTPGNAV
nr:hypothetical protein [Desulfobulbaceae bacterium]